MATPTPMGAVRVERVRGRSALTRCFARYPLKLIAPSRVGPSSCDAVWLYALTYGGGIVSGDTVSCTVSVGDGCTAAITTQASTKVYKAVGSKCSEQLLEARVGEDALLAVIPDPVTCFSTARYHQKQVFHVSVNSNLVLVDWFTSGRYESGERWDFSFYKSVNHIFLGDQPLFIDSAKAEGHPRQDARRSEEANVGAAAPSHCRRKPLHYEITASPKATTRGLLQPVRPHGNRHGCSGSRGEHGAGVHLPEAPSGRAGAIPWRSPLRGVMKLADRLREALVNAGAERGILGPSSLHWGGGGGGGGGE
ncbi:urease accessory protein D isoform X1 [Zea mays]|nr:urease accessory protein D isoform X1 [Zea mays]